MHKLSVRKRLRSGDLQRKSDLARAGLTDSDNHLLSISRRLYPVLVTPYTPIHLFTLPKPLSAPCFMSLRIGANVTDRLSAHAPHEQVSRQCQSLSRICTCSTQGSVGLSKPLSIGGVAVISSHLLHWLRLLWFPDYLYNLHSPSKASHHPALHLHPADHTPDQH